MTREDILVLNVVEPNCFETDREEEWYNCGLIQGVEIANKEILQKALDWIDKTFDQCGTEKDPEIFCHHFEYVKELKDDFIREMNK